jgi:hypothetical protein
MGDVMDGQKDGWHELIFKCWLWELMGDGVDGRKEGWMTWANLRALALRTNGWQDGWMDDMFCFFCCNFQPRLRTWVLGHENKASTWQVTTNKRWNRHSSIYIHLSMYRYQFNFIPLLRMQHSMHLHVEHGDRLLFLKSFNSQLVL